MSGDPGSLLTIKCLLRRPEIPASTLTIKRLLRPPEILARTLIKRLLRHPEILARSFNFVSLSLCHPHLPIVTLCQLRHMATSSFQLCHFVNFNFITLPQLRHLTNFVHFVTTFPFHRPPTILLSPTSLLHFSIHQSSTTDSPHAADIAHSPIVFVIITFLHLKVVKQRPLSSFLSKLRLSRLKTIVLIHLSAAISSAPSVNLPPNA